MSRAEMNQGVKSPFSSFYFQARAKRRLDHFIPGQRAPSVPGYSSQKDLIPDIQSLCQYLSPLFPNLSLTVFHFRNMTLRD